ncbi:hypothetical protein SKAU_G00156480 [Synaphobranchus kaupii]|uniref:Uncharacterized protein n=1 Tax=Synaphobranchus kaupii TaxID=118154 RepID=A0A9Q1FHM8_SYNKA|nr:hypothetical protein SKAU_G00156480 [Synaphobranchus kaupii]
MTGSRCIRNRDSVHYIGQAFHDGAGPLPVAVQLRFTGGLNTQTSSPDWYNRLWQCVSGVVPVATSVLTAWPRGLRSLPRHWETDGGFPHPVSWVGAPPELPKPMV